MRQLILELAAEGRTVVLCSHLLHEVEQVCDSLAILQRGRVIAQGKTREIVGRRTELEIVIPEMDAAEAIPRASPWNTAVRRDDGVLRISGQSVEGRVVNRYLADHGLFADELRMVRQSLEEAFFELTDEAVADD